MRKIIFLLGLLFNCVQLNALSSGEMDAMLQKAKNGDAFAQACLGTIYYHGSPRITVPNYKEALKWNMLSAKQGFAPAEFNVGYAYFTGEGVARDLKEAMKWFEKVLAHKEEDLDFLRVAVKKKNNAASFVWYTYIMRKAHK